MRKSQEFGLGELRACLGDLLWDWSWHVWEDVTLNYNAAEVLILILHWAMCSVSSMCCLPSWQCKSARSVPDRQPRQREQQCVSPC